MYKSTIYLNVGKVFTHEIYLFVGEVQSRSIHEWLREYVKQMIGS